jgi:hypothetical protein
MANPTTLVNGQNVTSVASETEYELTRPFDIPFQYVRIELVSGSVQFGVFEKTTVFTPQINTERTYSTAGDKVIFTVENGKFNLRAKGSGVFTITW